MKRNPEDSLDAVLHASGPEQLDYLVSTIRTERILGDEASPDGLSHSLLHGRIGEQVDAIGQFLPGQDASHNLDIRNTYATGLPMARKVLTEANPSTVHVVLDLPERVDTLTGNYRAKKIGSFLLALCSRVARDTDSDLVVYHNDGTQTGKIYDGSAMDMYDAYNQIEGHTPRTSSLVAEPHLSVALKMANQNIDPENEALVVVSDFLDGYSKENHTFDWEDSLLEANEALGDRLWTTRITSPAQTKPPYRHDVPLSVNGLNSVSNSYGDIAEAKDVRINERLDITRSISIDTFRKLNQEHPVRMMARFILGSEQ